MVDYLLHHNANTHWRYPTSQETDALLATRGGRSPRSSGPSPDEIAFGANMTTLTFHLARALGRGWAPGDEIVVTELDHHANVAPWRALARERGVTIRVARMIPETGELDLDDLERQIGPRTRLVAIGAASNALGTINDVAPGRRAGARGRRAGVRRRGPLRAARAGRRRGARLRLPRVLGLQVLRAARRRPVRHARPARVARRAEARRRRPRRARAARRPARRTTRGSSGRAAAVEFLASLAGRGRPASRPGSRAFDDARTSAARR